MLDLQLCQRLIRADAGLTIGGHYLNVPSLTILSSYQLNFPHACAGFTSPKNGGNRTNFVAGVEGDDVVLDRGVGGHPRRG